MVRFENEFFSAHFTLNRRSSGIFFSILSRDSQATILLHHFDMLTSTATRSVDARHYIAGFLFITHRGSAKAKKDGVFFWFGFFAAAFPETVIKILN